MPDDDEIDRSNADDRGDAGSDNTDEMIEQAEEPDPEPEDEEEDEDEDDD